MMRIDAYTHFIPKRFFDKLTDFAGGNRYLERGNVVAGSPGVVASLREAAAGIVDEQLI